MSGVLTGTRLHLAEDAPPWSLESCFLTGGDLATWLRHVRHVRPATGASPRQRRMNRDIPRVRHPFQGPDPAAPAGVPCCPRTRSHPSSPRAPPTSASPRRSSTWSTTSRSHCCPFRATVSRRARNCRSRERSPDWPTGGCRVAHTERPGSGHHMWLPLLDGAERLGVMEVQVEAATAQADDEAATWHRWWPSSSSSTTCTATPSPGSAGGG